MDEITKTFEKTIADLKLARESLAQKLRQLDGMIAALSAPSLSLPAPVGPVKTLEELILKTVEVSDRPLKSTEIAEIISSVRPTKPYVVSSLLSRLQDKGKIKKQGMSGSYLFSAPKS